MAFNWKKAVIIVLDIALAVYFVLAVTSFNNPDETSKVCTKVAINIADESTNGFLSAAEIKKILERNKIYPLEKRMAFVDPRQIEDILKASPFVNTAQCYTTQDGHVCINITQRLPIVRIKSNNGDDYYLDDKGGIMPNSKYTSDLIIATGSINKWYAQTYLGCLSKSKDKEERQNLIDDYIGKKMQRLEKFYKYGLSEAGWNKYSYISLEFDNQIICKKKNHKTDN